MKKKVKKWGLTCLVGIILLLILTNPSNTQYTEFLKSKGFKLEIYYPDYGESPGPYYENGKKPYFEPFWGKRFNYFIFSTYSYQVKYGGNYTFIKCHVGILSNFFETKSPIIK